MSLHICVYNDGCSLVLNQFVMYGEVGILRITLIVQEISSKATHKNSPQNTAKNIWIFWHWQDEKMDQTPYVQANSVRLKARGSVTIG